VGALFDERNLLNTFVEIAPGNQFFNRRSPEVARVHLVTDNSGLNEAGGVERFDLLKRRFKPVRNAP
jgi:hypothetical protein